MKRGGRMTRYEALMAEYDHLIIEEHSMKSDGLYGDGCICAWAYEKMVPLKSIQQAFIAGHYEPWEIADYLDVDERFLREAMQYYEEVHGDELIRQRQEAELREALQDAGIDVDK